MEQGGAPGAPESPDQPDVRVAHPPRATHLADERRPVLVVHADGDVRRALARLLRPLRRPVLQAEGPGEAHASLAAGPALALVEHGASLGDAGQELLAHAARVGCASLVLLGAGATFVDVSTLLGSSAFGHLVVEHGQPMAAEPILTTALKLLRQDLFGIDKYLAWGVEPLRLELARASGRRAAVALLHADLVDQGWGTRTASRAAHVADELLSNAVFNAPVDAGGHKLRAELSRTADLALDGRDRVELTYACDGRYVAVAVEDHYGSLDPRAAAQGLARQCGAGGLQPRGGSAGAGIGLALTCRMVDHLVFNVAPGVRTEVIGLIDLRRSPGVRESDVPSLNFFVFRTGV